MMILEEKKMELISKDGIVYITESETIEIKKAANGRIPQSIYESYSAFCNTYGGTIILGLEELSDTEYKVIGVEEPIKMIDGIMTTLNNKQKISKNLLTLSSFKILDLDEAKVILISVPRASYDIRPIYLNDDISDTYIRSGRGDRKCRLDELKSMLRDASTGTQDNAIIDDYDYRAAIDQDTLKAYRKLYDADNNKHPFSRLSDDEFLEKINAIRPSKNGMMLTLAGLLMFGKFSYIINKLPMFSLEYIEVDEDKERYLDRIIYDGSWGEGNIFNFFMTVMDKIERSLPNRFRLAKDSITRLENGGILNSLRELLVNCLIHADHRAEKRIRIIKRKDEYIFENPGCLRISKDDYLLGRKSVPRNPNLMRMFRVVDFAEETGYGVLMVQMTIKEYGLRELLVEDMPDSVKITFSIRKEMINDLNDKEKAVYEAIKINGKTSRKEIEEYTRLNMSTVTRILRDLVDKGLIKVNGRGRSTHYSL